MRRQTVVTILVAALVLLSGCSGFIAGGGNDTQTTPEPTATTTTTTTTTTTPDEGVEYPIGVSADGVTNQESLLAAHTDALANESIKTTISVNSNLSDQTTTYNYQSKSGNDFSFSATQELVQRSSTQYYDSTTDEGVYIRKQSGNETSYSVRDPLVKESAFERMTQTRFFETFLGVFEYEVSSTSTGDTQLNSTSVTDRQNLKRALGVENISTASMDLTVSESGVITNAELFVDTGDSVNQYNVSVQSGGVTVGEPSWLDEAQQQAPAMDVSVSENNSYFVLDYTQGRDISEGTVVYVSSAERNQQATVESPLKSGKTYYVSFAGESPEIVTEPPTEGSIEPGTYRIIGLSPSNEVLFEENLQVGEDSTK